MRLYLAGPMRGIKQLNREAFKNGREQLRDMGHEVFCPSEMTDTIGMSGGKTGTREMLKYDIAWILGHADGIVCLPSWQFSRGALAEVHIAWAINIPVYEYELFVRRVIREVKIVPSEGS